MKLSMKTVAVAAFAAMLAVGAVAQGGGGQGRGQGGGRGQGQMGGMRGGDNSLATLQRKDVQKELAVTSEQVAKIEALAKKNQEDMRAAREAMQNGGGDRTAMQEMQKKAQEATKKEIEKILTADQNKRFKEIQIQMMGGRALMNADVQKELGVTADQKAKIEAVQASQRDKMQDMMQQMRDGNLDRTQMQEAMQKMNQSIADEMIKVLTADQKTKFEAMKGKPFKADPNERTGRGGGGGGGGL